METNIYRQGHRYWVVALRDRHQHEERPVEAAPIRLVTDEHRPDSIQKRASLHETAVQKVAAEGVTPKRRRASKHRRPQTETKKWYAHPAYVMAHAIGVPDTHVQIIEEPPRWSCVIWNHPAPWPGVNHEETE